MTPNGTNGASNGNGYHGAGNDSLPWTNGTDDPAHPDANTISLPASDSPDLPAAPAAPTMPAEEPEEPTPGAPASLEAQPMYELEDLDPRPLTDQPAEPPQPRTWPTPASPSGDVAAVTEAGTQPVPPSPAQYQDAIAAGSLGDDDRMGPGTANQGPPLPRPASTRYGLPDPMANTAYGPGDSGGGNRNDRGSSTTFPLFPIFGIIILAAIGAVFWLSNSSGDETAQTVSSEDGVAVVSPETEAAVADVRSLLGQLNLGDVVVDARDGVIYLAGPIGSQADRDAVVGAAQVVAGDVPVDSGSLMVATDGTLAPATVEPAPASPAIGGDAASQVQAELDRIVAVNPLIFDIGQADLTDLHRRALDNAARVLLESGSPAVTIIGYTDGVGADDANRQLSQTRADRVREYLVSLGVPADSLRTEGIGEADSTGAAGLAGLERRVEFEVGDQAEQAAAPAPDRTIRVGIVAPSARNDLAFTQSMVDAVNVVAGERPLEIDITDNTFVPEEAAAVIDNYAANGFDLIIAHGSQFGAALVDIAPRYPDTAFAWGTASDTFGLPNVYAYDAAAQEGGYVLGAVATMVSQSRVTGVVGPIEVGDAAKYVNGFRAGAAAEDPGNQLIVTYTGSFSDIPLATETANAQLTQGADVLTGSAQMVAGAITAAEAQGALWFGTQADQSPLAPGTVVASQVYRWEVALRPIVDDVVVGRPAGDSYTATLANGGLEIVFNPNAPVAPEVQDRANELIAAIAGGAIVPPG